MPSKKRYDQKLEDYRINRLFQQDKKECTNSCMETLKAVKSLTQKREDFGATFGIRKESH